MEEIGNEEKLSPSSINLCIWFFIFCPLVNTLIGVLNILFYITDKWNMWKTKRLLRKIARKDNLGLTEEEKKALEYGADNLEKLLKDDED
jgi:hypothetical protein